MDKNHMLGLVGLVFFSILVSSIIIISILPAQQPELKPTMIAPTLSPEPTVVVTETPTPEPTPVLPEYVMCSDYHKVTDKYKTPDGNYHITVGSSTYGITNFEYANVSVGGYIKYRFIEAGGTDGRFIYFSDYFELQDTVKTLSAVSEEESGYRYACRVERVVP